MTLPRQLGPRLLPSLLAVALERRLLFDLSADPLEQTNLLDASKLSAKTAELADALDETLRGLVATEPGRVEKVELDEQAIERLRALGYVR